MTAPYFVDFTTNAQSQTAPTVARSQFFHSSDEAPILESLCKAIRPSHAEFYVRGAYRP
jgi:hypothetical protein